MKAFNREVTWSTAFQNSASLLQSLQKGEQGMPRGACAESRAGQGRSGGRLAEKRGGLGPVKVRALQVGGGARPWLGARTGCAVPTRVPRG